MQHVVDSLRSVIGFNAVISAGYFSSCMGENQCIAPLRACEPKTSDANVTLLVSRRLCVTCVVLVFGLVTFPEFRFAGGMLTATQAAWCSESANEPHYVPEVKDAVACIDPARIPLSVQHTRKYFLNKLKQARYQTLKSVWKLQSGPFILLFRGVVCTDRKLTHSHLPLAQRFRASSDTFSSSRLSNASK